MKKTTLILAAIIIFFSNCSPKTQSGNNTKKENKTEKRTRVKIITDFGEMVIELYNETPKHRDNFIKLANEKFFNDVLFHRIIQGFMIQGGDPDSKDAPKGKMLGNGGPGYDIDAEMDTNFIHKKGALAAARTSDNINPKRKSSGSQFYIVQGRNYSMDELKMIEKRRGTPYSEQQITSYITVGGTPQLDMSYTVFGEVIKGFDVIDAIAAQPKDNNDRPISDIKMKIEVIK